MLEDYHPGNFRALAVVYFSFILVVSLAPMPPSPPTLNLDKLMHAGLYYGFAFILWRGFSSKKLLAFAFTYGILIEIIQPTFGRTFDYFDMLANGMGIFLFYWFFAKK